MIKIANRQIFIFFFDFLKPNMGIYIHLPNSTWVFDLYGRTQTL